MPARGVACLGLVTATFCLMQSRDFSLLRLALPKSHPGGRAGFALRACGPRTGLGADRGGWS